ncbi:GAF domain-like protein [Lineolata rhizophorae]|uniref:GAF domain-like protein n=1 Tax=Lineolata rhizophorae TaxID=578093 RepID=A0A6A6NR41_9PEZI|nr:GAF domain-like protein [Lineolata rhizophorae]
MGGVVTARFKHVLSEGGHAIITGRDGETLQRCEDEPIHIPGAVQSFGLLVALQEGKEGRLVVRVVSENSKRMIGYSPRDLFALESFTDILSEEQADNLMDHIDFIRDEDTDVEVNGPEVFTMSIRTPKRRLQKLWCAVHVSPSNADVIVCEFELEDDRTYPLVPSDDATPELPEDTLHSQPTPEEFLESTENASKPLRVLRTARKRKGEAAAMEVFNIMSQVQEQLAAAPNLEKFLKILVGVVKELTGFHRVMIYQFDQAWNGKVVTELLDPRATKDLYKGLHFPASDIPKQARDLYKINKVRLLYDRDMETARLVCRTVEDLEKPLDLTFSYLRAMSPIHLKYLANMAVRSSMSISINAFNELWGLISCHSYGAKGMRVSFPIRKMCRLVGDSASRNIERLSYASRLQARKLINTVPTQGNPSGYIVASSEDLLKLFNADFGLLSIRGETKILGEVDQTQEALAMLEYLRMRRITSVTVSQDLIEDFPDLRYAPGFHHIAGLLLVPLSVVGDDFIVFFRKGQLKEVKWAGNPYEKFVREGTEGYLEPRKSFRQWSETVIGKCTEWTEEEVETAAVLCLVYGKFIEVWRQKEAALQNSQLTRLLLANSAHEVRTPLNAVINYLEIALEGTLDQETRENLVKSHSASKSLIYVINDLLDLTKAEEGGDLLKGEPFDLQAAFREAADPFGGDCRRKGIEYEVIEHQGLPRKVIGDQSKIRQAITNIIANAIQNTTTGNIRVEMYLMDHVDSHVEVEVAVEDSGAGMSLRKLDALFRELEQAQSESSLLLEETFAPKHSKSKAIANQEGADRTLGLGLAIVARIIRNMNGQLRLKSEEGRGSRFVLQFPFELPDDEKRSIADSTTGSTGPEQEVPFQNDIMLVKKDHERPSSVGDGSAPLVRRESTESVRSSKSKRSFKSVESAGSGASAKSDVDRLIDAIKTPHLKESKSGSTGATSTKSVLPLGRGPSSPIAAEKRRLKARSFESTSAMNKAEHQRSMQQPTTPGEQRLPFDLTPVKAVKVPDNAGSPLNDATRWRPPSGVLGEVEPPQLPSAEQAEPEPEPESAELTARNMHVLVAEDDPVNSKIVKKRLEKVGHKIYLTVNGEECASAYGDQPDAFDVVLMDMQVRQAAKESFSFCFPPFPNSLLKIETKLTQASRCPSSTASPQSR